MLLLSASYASGQTSAPTLLGSQSLLITLFKGDSKDASSQGNTFRKTLTTAKRVIMLANNNLFVGFYVITPGKRLHLLFQPQRCTFTNANTGIEQEFLLGHSSNDPCFLRAEYTSVNVAKMLAYIVNTNLDDIPRCFRSGPAFTVGDITATTTLTDTLSIKPQPTRLLSCRWLCLYPLE